MSKHYIFYKKDIINLLLNHKAYISNKCKELMAQGRDVRFVTLKESEYWTECFFDEEVEKGVIKLETILYEVDSLLEHTHGKGARSVAEDIKERS